MSAWLASTVARAFRSSGGNAACKAIEHLLLIVAPVLAAILIGVKAMKVHEPVYSAEVEALLEQREIEVDCWKCAHTARLTLHWLSTHRDMCCAECGNLIILNTSKLQGEVARLRRQLSALHSQMSGVLNDVARIGRPPTQDEIKPQFKLALASLNHR